MGFGYAQAGMRAHQHTAAAGDGGALVAATTLVGASQLRAGAGWLTTVLDHLHAGVAGDGAALGAASTLVGAATITAFRDAVVHALGGDYIVLSIMGETAVGAGTWSYAHDVSASEGGNLSNAGSHADGDNISFEAYMEVGTYTLQLIVVTAASYGILDVDVDAAEVGSHDCYSAGTVYNVDMKTTSIAMGTAGLKTIRLRVDGKHGSSSDHYVSISSIRLYRTA